MTSRSPLPALSLVFVLLSAACSAKSSGGSAPEACPAGATCVEPPRGPSRAHRADDTVDVTVDELWPNRGTEPAPLTGDVLAHACAILARCNDATEKGRFTLLQACLQDHSDLIWEERAVPTPGKNERFTFEALGAIANAADCKAVNAVATTAPDGLHCEEDGCWWMSNTLPLPQVTCSGTTAILTSDGRPFSRDCAHAYAACDPSSPTGCTDRAPMACDTPAADRCDGPFRIGCDGTGKVSFHDCSRAGGVCGSVGNGALGCVYPNGGQCSEGEVTCDGSALSACSFGQKIAIPFDEIGLTSCPAP